MLRRGLLLLLLAVPVHAAGITSFEPDSTRERRDRPDREPMVETPIWFGTTVSMGSFHDEGWRGFANAPRVFSGIGFGVTWPWRSRLQGWGEWSYRIRKKSYEYTNPWLTGINDIYYPQPGEAQSDLFTGRSGVEFRFGARGRPWCTAGTGLGLGISFDESDAGTASELLARVTCYAYPSRRTRLGLMLSGGPVWMFRGDNTYALLGDRGVGQSEVLTHYELSLRIESRLRFPQANAD